MRSYYKFQNINTSNVIIDSNHIYYTILYDKIIIFDKSCLLNNMEKKM